MFSEIGAEWNEETYKAISVFSVYQYVMSLSITVAHKVNDTTISNFLIVQNHLDDALSPEQ